MSYVGPIITFIAALIALKGGTWDANHQRRVKLTRTGIIAGIVALVGVMVSLIFAYTSNKESKIRDSDIKSTSTFSVDSNKRIKELEEKIRIYREMLGEVRDESRRQPQIVMAQYVVLHRRQKWDAPNRLYSGSIVKFYGFRCNLILEYGNRLETISSRGWDRPVEVAIFGENGEGLPWSVRSEDGVACEGKIYVESSPRIRSRDWSWEEERRGNR